MIDSVDFAWSLAIVALLFSVSAHVLHQRLARPKDAFVFINRFLLVMVPAIALAAIASYGATEAVEPKLATQALCCLAFLFLPFVSFYGIIEHAVRARISMELCRAPEGLALSHLLRRYDPEAETMRRLDELITAGFLVRDGEKLTLTAKGRLFADVASLSKRLFAL